MYWPYNRKIGIDAKDLSLFQRELDQNTDSGRRILQIKTLCCNTDNNCPLSSRE